MSVTSLLPDSDGRLVDNIVHFARALRKAGIRVGPAQVEAAMRAVETAGFTRREDFFYTLRSTMVNRAEHLDLFSQVFTMFWRDPEYLERMIHLMSPVLHGAAVEEKARKAAERRASEALGDGEKKPQEAPVREEIEVDARLSWSATERLRSMDFEQMSAAETQDAATLVRSLKLPLPEIRTRRQVQVARGPHPDLRATLRASMRRGGELGAIRRRAPQTRAPDLVALCDISGSMASYSRMMLLFLHAIAHAPSSGVGHVHAFTFGTRLTNITRSLRQRDPDVALFSIGQEVRDWEGGTRIGDALADFNRLWSRRVLGQGGVVLLITDGLERGDPDRLEAEAIRLSLSCRRLIWLNPLLRWDGFSPMAGGIQAILPHVDGFYACHSVNALSDFAGIFDPRVTRSQRPGHLVSQRA